MTKYIFYWIEKILVYYVLSKQANTIFNENATYYVKLLLKNSGSYI